MEKTILYNGREIEAQVSAGWVKVNRREVRTPAIGDIVEVDGVKMQVIDNGKRRRPTMAPPRTHWQLPVEKLKDTAED